MRRQVLLYSGGLDSVIMAHMLPEAKLLYIPSGSRYNVKELTALKKRTLKRLEISEQIFVLPERDDLIVPARNVFFVTVASWQAEDVYLAATAGDISTDKDTAFAQFMSLTLTHVYACHHFKDREGSTQVHLPGKDMSKGQLVAWALNNGQDAAELREAVSCYHPLLTACGICKPCMRKWAALLSNGITCENWHVDPRNAAWRPVIDALQSEQGWRCPDEDRYTLEILRDEGVLSR